MTALVDADETRSRYWAIESPVGPLTLLSSGGGLSGVLFSDTTTLGSYMRDRTPFELVIEQLEEYFEGKRTGFVLELAPRGTPFQSAVWQELQRIPFGETRSYGQIASAIGRPGASRAVGAANGQNPIPIIIPCHRVLGSSGSLVGFGGGLPAKRWLLEHEGQFSLFRK